MRYRHHTADATSAREASAPANGTLPVRVAGRPLRLLALAASLLCAIVCLSSCAPRGRAVGDTQDTQATISHDYIDRSDYGVALVGSGTDDDLVQKFRAGAENSSLSVFYAQAATGEQQRKAVEDFAKRKVTFIVVHPDDTSDASTSEAWEKSLGVARDAGIPVILLDGRIDPDNQLLYAADFIPTDSDEDIENNVYSLYHALAAVINADAHEKQMYVRM